MSNPLRLPDDISSDEAPSWKELYAQRKLSPRVRLYGSGIAKTMEEASRLANLNPMTLYGMNAANNPEFKRLVGLAEEHRDIATGDISIVLQRLGRKALDTINRLREDAESEAVQLKAAIDLADRSSETSKIQRHAIATISIEGEDVERLTKTLVESASVRVEYAHLASGDFVRVSTDAPVPLALSVAPAQVIDEPTPKASPS
jgi:hypothetical protein